MRKSGRQKGGELQREWDGRGAGISGWGTQKEEDLWEAKLDFGASSSEDGFEDGMTVGELMEWRYFKAERQKERVSTRAVWSASFVYLRLAVHCFRETKHLKREITTLPSNITLKLTASNPNCRDINLTWPRLILRLNGRFYLPIIEFRVEC